MGTATDTTTTTTTPTDTTTTTTTTAEPTTTTTTASDTTTTTTAATETTTTTTTPTATETEQMLKLGFTTYCKRLGKREKCDSSKICVKWGNFCVPSNCGEVIPSAESVCSAL